MIRDGFKNANKRTKGGDPFREDCSELVLQPILLRASLWAVLSPGSCLLPADRHQPTWSHCAGTTQAAGGSTATAPGLHLGLCCTSHFNLMLKMFKSHCQVHVKLPPHIRSVQQVSKRPTLPPRAEEILRLGNDVAGLEGALGT